MKQRVYCFLLVTMICIVCCFFSTRSKAASTQKDWLRVEYENAPEGTVYVDILVKMDQKDENYVEFNVAPRRMLGRVKVDGKTEFKYADIVNLTKDSEIAKYHEDGFMSLTIHSLEVEDFIRCESALYIDPAGPNIFRRYFAIYLRGSAVELINKYKRVKIAYVDSNGEILKVTRVSNKVSNKKLQDGFGIFTAGDTVGIYADGDTVGIYAARDKIVSLFMAKIAKKDVFFFLIPSAIIISFICFLVKKICSKKKKL